MHTYRSHATILYSIFCHKSFHIPKFLYQPEISQNIACVRHHRLLQVATLVAILKTARQMGLYQDLGCVSVPSEGSVTIPEQLLQRAVASRVESLQVDALQLACVHPRTTSLPGKAMSSLLMWLSAKRSLHGEPACLLAPFQPLWSFPPCFPRPSSPHLLKALL